MSASPAWIRQWVAAHGPYLYHATDGIEAQSSILETGLIPWNQGPGSVWSDAYLPRIDHVYLGTLESLYASQLSMRWVVSVDIRGIDAARFNPDEDTFYSEELTDAPLNAAEFGLALPDQTVQDLNLLETLSNARDIDRQLDAFSTRPYRSYGAWAEAVDLGSDTFQTHASLTRAETVAVRNTIDPRWIEAVDIEIHGADSAATVAESCAVVA